MITQRTQAYVYTNRDSGPQERNERGASIIDASGGMVYLPDADLPRVIGLLAQHLSGETVALIAQTAPDSLWCHDEGESALADVDGRLAALHNRRAAVVTRLQVIAATDAVPEIAAERVIYVSLRDLLFPNVHLPTDDPTA